jgi:hypothetical protein
MVRLEQRNAGRAGEPRLLSADLVSGVHSDAEVWSFEPCDHRKISAEAANRFHGVNDTPLPLLGSIPPAGKASPPVLSRRKLQNPHTREKDERKAAQTLRKGTQERMRRSERE